MFKKIQQIHFVGIGGIGMSGIAEVLLNMGYGVSGSDLHETEITRRLASLGARVQYGHQPDHAEGAHVVVLSSAVSPDNVEVVAARRRSIPVIPRAEMLAELMRLKYGVAVAGSHGKTTTTSMIATVMARGALDPTAVIGGRLNSLGSNAKLGQGEFLVAEADESDRSFLKLSPTLVVVTNIDAEHLDHYHDLTEIKETFLKFINKVPFYGASILCLDDVSIQEILPRVERTVRTYGLNSKADFVANDIRCQGIITRFTVHHQEKRLGDVILHMPGLHNVRNALAAIALGMELELDFATIREGLQEFSGVQRRFQIRGEQRGIMVVDDYGHHPEEIKATLRAAREGWNRRIVVLFQPHRYTRTHHLFNQFLTAFDEADVLFITSIYPAGEEAIEGVSALQLVDGIRQQGQQNVYWVEEMANMVPEVEPILQPGDMVITLGAGSIWKVGNELMGRLQGSKD